MKLMMKLGLVAAAALLFLGCGDTTTLDEVSEEHAEEVEDRVEDAASPADALREEDSYFDSWTDSGIYGVFEATCEWFDNGGSVQGAIDTGIRAGTPAYSAGSITAAAIVFECPEYLDMAEDYVEGQGDY
jgi:hypothetical protein